MTSATTAGDMPAPVVKRTLVPEPSTRVRGYLLAGLAMTLFLTGGIGFWAANTEIAGAVIAPGVVVVESSVKKVQHPTGGVVGEIAVKNGDKVKAGDLLLRLDETVTRANLQVISKQLDEMTARQARLEAERDGAVDVNTPEGFKARLEEPAIQQMIAGEQTLFKSRNQSREGQKAQLRERIEQLKEEIAGVTGQIEAKGKEIELMHEELASLEQLESKQLVTTSRMVALRRDGARLEGEFGQLRANAAKAKGQISEIELQILRIDQDFKTDLMKELRETQAKIGEFTERRVAAMDQLKRVDIRAPQEGLVHQLSVHTVGGVVNPGEPILLIVPENDKLVVEARIAPHDIDQALISKTALIRFSAFSQRTTPELVAEVIRISADLTKDQQTGESYYVARLQIPDDELAKLAPHKLVPGMPADVQIRTQNRTALSYILKPVQDQFAKAFRER